MAEKNAEVGSCILEGNFDSNMESMSQCGIWAYISSFLCKTPTERGLMYDFVKHM